MSRLFFEFYTCEWQSFKIRQRKMMQSVGGDTGRVYNTN